MNFMELLMECRPSFFNQSTQSNPFFALWIDEEKKKVEWIWWLLLAFLLLVGYGRCCGRGSAKKKRTKPRREANKFNSTKEWNNERSVVGRQSIDGINLLMKSIDEAKTTTQVEHQAAPLRGKPKEIKDSNQPTFISKLKKWKSWFDLLLISCGESCSLIIEMLGYGRGPALCRERTPFHSFFQKNSIPSLLASLLNCPGEEEQLNEMRLKKRS